METHQKHKVNLHLYRAGPPEKKMVNEISVAGGLLIVGIDTNLLDVTNIRTGSMLPAIFYSILRALL